MGWQWGLRVEGFVEKVPKKAPKNELVKGRQLGSVGRKNGVGGESVSGN